AEIGLSSNIPMSYTVEEELLVLALNTGRRKIVFLNSRNMRRWELMPHCQCHAL
ncbi:hypothetical protein MKX03_033265, partial [Papaver bracteatum]